MEKQELYTTIWKNELPDILTFLEIFPHYGSKDLPAKDFIAAGNRDNSGFAFSIEFENGKVVKITNSAVARDLANVITASAQAMAFFEDKRIVIKMDKNFTLHMSAEG